MLISHASKRRRVRQPGLVRNIIDDSHEIVWPDCKECSASVVFLFDRVLVFSEPSIELPSGLPDVAFVAILNTLVTSLYIFITPEEGLC